MRKLPIAFAALSALTISSAAPTSVAPPTPEYLAMMKKREALEYQARMAFGDIGLIEKLRDWRKTWGFVLINREGARRPPRLLVKDEYGWYEMRPGQTRRLPLALGLELNRLLNKGELWNEDAFNFRSKCRGTASLFLIMHAGHDKFGRLGCGAEGLAARVARTAEAGRALSGEARTTAPPGQEVPDPPGASPAYFQASRRTSGHLFEMAAAWERKTLAGFVEPYAPDVVMEGPFGTYRGRKMVVDWARSLQDWNAPYSENDKRIRVERIVSKNQPASGVFYTNHELRWEEGGKPLRQTFSTMWRDYGGQWLISHEKVSDVKPVTGERIPW